jgi:predicted transcriptional regulator
MVQAALPRSLAYTTVLTVLQRLYAKGIVARQRQGRAYAYRPVVAAAEMAAQRMREALDGGRDRTAVLQHFVSSLSVEEEATLQQLLDPEL